MGPAAQTSAQTHAQDSKCVAGTIKEGIKLLADGKSIFTSTNVRIEVSRVSEEAKAHITR